MRFPISLTTSMAKYMAHQQLLGREKFPLVMMLEPLHACNLTCTGCGRIREYKPSISDMLSVEECLASVDECGAPIVSICGGEPLIYPQIGRLVEEILERKKHIYLCTNAVFLPEKLDQFKPSTRLIFNVHLDGMEATHDLIVEREGVFKQAIDAIKVAKSKGFLVFTNTTIYRETDMAEIEEMLEFLTPFNCDGHLLSPAYPYDAVKVKEIFLTREEIREKFKDIDRLAQRYKLNLTPMYQDFLKGARELPCTMWGNPTRNILGWKAPCYMMTDGHYDTFQELMDGVDWDSYGPGRDPRCEHCMVHCGFEPSAALGKTAKMRDHMRVLQWQFA